MGNHSSISSKPLVSFKKRLIKKHDRVKKGDDKYQNDITEIQREKEFRQRQIAKNHYGDYIFDHRAPLKRGPFGTIHLAIVRPKKNDSSLKMVVVKVTPIAIKYYNRWFIGDKCVNEANAIKWNNEYVNNEAKTLSCLCHAKCDDLIKDPDPSKFMKEMTGFYGPECDPREHIPFEGFKKADMYSLGVTIYVVLTYHLPFDPSQSIRHQSLLFPDYISLSAQHFIQNLLSIDPLRRMTISDCFNHSWLRIHDISGHRPKHSSNITNQSKKIHKKHFNHLNNHHIIHSRRNHLFSQKNCDINCTSI
ncbi:serine/threonine-protein kinase pim-1-like [Gigaspora margarita]|uniref:Serine/threonine-protein kinase pim-1-like n=1 Tax=Gigaspora margarita TaxID=4874 RepID=A0A8H3X7K4_GIGMA|nr:serine/threonine-protein kinase pim-1-like [Gigaspora margarita]